MTKKAKKAKKVTTPAYIGIKPSEDRKVRARSGQKNTFGILPGRDGSCPGATRGCGGCESPAEGNKTPVCYVYGLMRAYSGVRGVLEHNTRELKAADRAGMADLLKREFERFAAAEARARVPGSAYRIHWSGDIFSRTYAEALVDAMREFPAIKFWCYTRSIPYGVLLAQRLDNLSMYLSLDKVNLYAGLRGYFDALADTGNVLRSPLHLAYMAERNDFAEAYARAYNLHDVLQTVDAQSGDEGRHHPWPVKPVKLASCPVDEGSIPLEGGCHACRMCFRANPAHVFFQT